MGTGVDRHGALMRVLFVGNNFPRPRDPRRAIYNLDMVSQLSQLNDVRVIAPVSWIEACVERLTRRPRVNPEDPCPTVRPLFFYPPRALSASRHWWFWQSCRGVARSLFRSWRPDAVLSYWIYPDGAAALRIARETGARTVLITGGSDVLRPGDERQRARVGETLRAADAVVAVSGDLRNRVLEFGVAPERVHVMKRSVDVQRFSPGDQLEARRHVGLPPDVPVVLWIGFLVQLKRVDVLLHAFAELLPAESGAQLVLIGDGPLRGALVEDVKRLGLETAVTFTGEVPHEGLCQWLRAADVVALPSESEGLPNVLLEAIACDRPFVASAVGGIPEIADPEIDRLVPPGDVRALSAALRAVLAARAIPRPRRAAPPRPGDTARWLTDILRAPRVGASGVATAERERPSVSRQVVRLAMAAVLPRRRFCTSVSPRRQSACLTFDDGPDPVVTPRILATLQQAGVRATFFVVGERAIRHPDLLRQMAADGHEIAHHSFFHAAPSSVDAAAFVNEVERTGRAVAAFGVKMSRLVRPPHGKLTAAKFLRLWLARYCVVLWNKDLRDYRAATAAEVLDRARATRVVAGDIVLLHDTQPQTAEALGDLIRLLKADGLWFTTVSRALTKRWHS